MWPLWLLALAFVFGLGWYLGEKRGEGRERRESLQAWRMRNR
jgi:lipopolysaccharide biosynthesis regulator YciM